MGQNITEDRIIHPYKKKSYKQLQRQETSSIGFQPNVVRITCHEGRSEASEKALKAKVMRIEKVLINYRLRVSKVS